MSEINCEDKASVRAASEHVRGKWYPRYVLLVLLLVYIFNYVDRQILAILAEDIKADLGITDAQLGFLFGTAFSVFYATFGVALGRLADIWDRRKLIAVGVGFWSAMTALSGFARNFLVLAGCRFGVGIGEASAAPASYSILYDYFPPKVRTTVLAIYASGTYVGMGLGLVLGGLTVDAWNSAWPDKSTSPFGLAGWQASFLIVGLPGLILALWVYTLREPIRGIQDGVRDQGHDQPIAETLLTLSCMIPGLNLYTFRCLSRSLKPVWVNILAAGSVTIIGGFLTHITGDVLQWTALGIGVYAAFSWMQGLAIRDAVAFGMIFQCPTVLRMIIAAGPMVFIGIAFPFWAIPYLQRVHDVSASQVGMITGVGTALAGFFGMLAGGLLSDYLRQYTRKGKILVWFGGHVGAVLCAGIFLLSENTVHAFAVYFVMLTLSACSASPYVSTLNDLVLPRCRATTSAFSTMVVIFIGGAIGPYFVGYLSDQYIAAGRESGEALRLSMAWSLLIGATGAGLALRVFSKFEQDEGSLLDRARALGERV